MRHGEEVRSALLRHVENDLGPTAMPQLPPSTVPFAVAEYFPWPGISPLSDTRQHAVALAYVVPVAGDCEPRQDALELAWLTPEEAVSEVVVSEMEGGRGTSGPAGAGLRRLPAVRSGQMRVAVFTGSSMGPESHRLAVARFGRELAEAGVGIVYGGARVGLMGVVADAALAAGGEVFGVMPQHLVDLEIAHGGLTRLDIVATMHERKARMADLADAFVALPGGAGTMEEVFEVWTWGQLGLHHKPTALLDLDGFYRPLLEQIQTMTDTGYLAPSYRDSLGVVTDAETFLQWARPRLAGTHAPDPAERLDRA